MRGLRIIALFIFALAITLYGCKKANLPKTVPSLTTVPVSEVTDITAVCGGIITSNGNDEITKVGVCYSTHSGSTLSDQVVEFTGKIGVLFNVTMTGLSPNTEYYVRPFATNSQGTSYGTTEQAFTTSASLPTVTTAVTSILSSSALFKGEITNNGGGNITSAGFCYSTSPGPTTQNNVVTRSTLTDTFSVHQFNLDTTTTYYVRTFATNSAGTGYGNEITFSTTSPQFTIGENYQGGLIFYVDDSEIHGLIVAETDQSTNSTWGCDGTSFSGATSISLGYGLQNSNDIIAGCGISSAAYICTNLNLNGYSDWYLPSKLELDMIYQNLHSKGLGGFSSVSYWTSTQIDANTAWSHSFSSNTQNPSGKTFPYYVRAVRAF